MKKASKVSVKHKNIPSTALTIVHKSTPTGPPPANAPLAVARIFRPTFRIRAHPKYKDAIVASGSEYMQVVSVPTGGDTVVGKCLANFYLAPNEFADSRLAQFANLYEKFRFTKFRLEWDPAVAATQAGSIVIAYDPDIQDPTPPATSTGVRQYCAYEDNAVGRIWEKFTVPCSLKAPDTGYYTNAAPYGTWGGDDRLAYQGQVYVATVAPSNMSAPGTMGTLIMHYDCEFFVPQLETFMATSRLPNNGSTLPTTADGFKPFKDGAVTAGCQVSAASVLGLIPTDVNGVAHLKLQEGLYEMGLKYLQNQAGAITLNDPTMIAYEPETAPAPVVGVRQLLSVNSNAVGNAAVGKWLLNVPRGGAAVLQSLASVSGMAAGAASDMQVARLGSYLADLASAIY